MNCDFRHVTFYNVLENRHNDFQEKTDALIWSTSKSVIEMYKYALETPIDHCEWLEEPTVILCVYFIYKCFLYLALILDG